MDLLHVGLAGGRQQGKGRCILTLQRHHYGMEFIDIRLPTKCQLVNVYSAFKELIGFRFDQRRFLFHNPNACVNEETLQLVTFSGS